MQRPEIGDDGAAVIEVGGHLLAQPGARHHVVGQAEIGLHAGQFALQDGMVGGRGRADEAAAADGMAGDALLLDEGQGAVIGRRQVAIDGAGMEFALGGFQVDIRLLQRASQESGISTRGTEARPFPVEHRDASSGPRQGQGRAQAGVARSDDDSVVGGQERAGRAVGERRGLPPVGRVLEVGGQQVLHRDEVL